VSSLSILRNVKYSLESMETGVTRRPQETFSRREGRCNWERRLSFLEGASTLSCEEERGGQLSCLIASAGGGGKKGVLISI